MIKATAAESSFIQHRVLETPAGMLNAIGLRSVVLAEKLPWLAPTLSDLPQ